MGASWKTQTAGDVTIISDAARAAAGISAKRVKRLDDSTKAHDTGGSRAAQEKEEDRCGEQGGQCGTRAGRIPDWAERSQQSRHNEAFMVVTGTGEQQVEADQPAFS